MAVDDHFVSNGIVGFSKRILIVVYETVGRSSIRTIFFGYMYRLHEFFKLVFNIIRIIESWFCSVVFHFTNGTLDIIKLLIEYVILVDDGHRISS